jgi:hypothetical protein
LWMWMNATYDFTFARDQDHGTNQIGVMG